MVGSDHHEHCCQWGAVMLYDIGLVLNQGYLGSRGLDGEVEGHSHTHHSCHVHPLHQHAHLGLGPAPGLTPPIPAPHPGSQQPVFQHPLHFGFQSYSYPGHFPAPGIADQYHVTGLGMNMPPYPQQYSTVPQLWGYGQNMAGGFPPGGFPNAGNRIPNLGGYPNTGRIPNSGGAANTNVDHLPSFSKLVRAGQRSLNNSGMADRIKKCWLEADKLGRKNIGSSCCNTTNTARILNAGGFLNPALQPIVDKPAAQANAQAAVTRTVNQTDGGIPSAAMPTRTYPNIQIRPGVAVLEGEVSPTFTTVMDADWDDIHD
ncbi:hypothetical protein V8E53_004064 [Lactarius tabidus]